MKWPGGACFPAASRRAWPVIIHGGKPLISGMDDKIYQQVVNVAAPPGIRKASLALPDAHRGYGFPVGGGAAFDVDEGGV